ncbi:hypothetical protein O9993_16620 [Vibrio lentus]|nr:hypothetical protein [Vibrio lentus]
MNDRRVVFTGGLTTSPPSTCAVLTISPVAVSDPYLLNRKTTCHVGDIDTVFRWADLFSGRTYRG